VVTYKNLEASILFITLIAVNGALGEYLGVLFF